MVTWRRLSSLRFLLTTAWAAAVAAPWPASAQTVQSAFGPTSYAVTVRTLDTLPNGNYRACSALPGQTVREQDVATLQRARREAQLRGDTELVKAIDRLIRLSNLDPGRVRGGRGANLNSIPVTVQAGSCFLFRKAGNGIIGFYQVAGNATRWCIRGTVNGNRILGTALSLGVLPNDYPLDSIKSRNLPQAIAPALNVAQIRIDKVFEFQSAPTPRYGILDVRGGVGLPGNSEAFTTLPRGLENQPIFIGEIRYNYAELNLEEFYLLNAGRKLPPQSCLTAQDLRRATGEQREAILSQYFSGGEDAPMEYFVTP